MKEWNRWRLLTPVRPDFSEANLNGADLNGADLSDAELYGAYLSGADLSEANLTGADLYGVNLSGADLSGADLSGADLSGADLHNSDIRRSVGVILDDNDIAGIRVSSKSEIPYFRLLAEYTGNRFLLVLALSAAAILPHGLAALFWKTVGAAERNSKAQELLGDQWEEVQIWKIVSGWHEGFWVFFLTIILVLYNVARFKATMKMEALRHEQEQSNYAPVWADYRIVWNVHHNCLRWVYWLSLGIMVWKITKLLFLESALVPIR